MRNRMQIRTLAALAVALVATAPLCAAAAEKFPGRPVRIVVGFQAGGGTDIAARVIAQKLTDALGVSSFGPFGQVADFTGGSFVKVGESGQIQASGLSGAAVEPVCSTMPAP